MATQKCTFLCTESLWSVVTGSRGGKKGLPPSHHIPKRASNSIIPLLRAALHKGIYVNKTRAAAFVWRLVVNTGGVGLRQSESAILCLDKVKGRNFSRDFWKEFPPLSSWLKENFLFRFRRSPKLIFSRQRNVAFGWEVSRIFTMLFGTHGSRRISSIRSPNALFSHGYAILRTSFMRPQPH